MKIFISVDMEGITGIVHFDQVLPEKEEYKQARELMVGDVNAAIEGALEAGAKEIVVNDSHNKMTNIILSQLNPVAHLISGFDKPLCMMQGVEGCDGTLLIGYHAKIGTLHAILDHTYYAPMVNCVRLNGIEVGEPEINTVIAGHFNVPVIFLSGDETVCRDAKAFIGEHLETAIVKKAFGRAGAECLHPEKSHQLIRDGVKKAISGLSSVKPFHVDLPVTVEVKFFTAEMADQAYIYPFVERINGRTIKVQGKTVLEGYRAFMSILGLARIF
ncbi:MAG TPA: M55 family metallopeptidase [Nitrospinota bacterium]|nr:M55 family metallopeptidase [Nitrospinota bacterium]